MIISKSKNVYDAGHKIGQHFNSPCNDYTFIPIPKCASTWATKFLANGLDWIISDEPYLPSNINKKVLVILRDPLDRWISGISQYMVTHHSDIPINGRELIEFIFKRVDFDPHTTPQVNFITDLDTNNITFFKFDKKLEYNFKTYIKEKMNTEYNEPVFRNDTPLSGYKPYAAQKLKILMNSNDKWLDSVKKYYHKDIELFNDINFINYEEV